MVILVPEPQRMPKIEFSSSVRLTLTLGHQNGEVHTASPASLPKMFIKLK